VVCFKILSMDSAENTMEDPKRKNAIRMAGVQSGLEPSTSHILPSDACVFSSLTTLCQLYMSKIF
jgi:hypothetical protein